MFLVIVINGNEKYIIFVVEVVFICDMKVIVLVGDDGGELVGLLGFNDVEICVLLKCFSCIVELYLVNLYCLSEFIDLILFL